MSIIKQNITAAILSGGQGSRFSGADKGLVVLHGQQLIEHVIERLTSQVSHILISANRNITLYQEKGYKVLEDEISGFAGPLAGILTALNHCQTEWLLVVPADCPFVPRNLAERLHQLTTKSKLVIAHDGERLQPAFALIHKSLLASLETFLQQGERKMRLWMKQHNSVTADFSDQPAAFMNINTESELKIAEDNFKSV